MLVGFVCGFKAEQRIAAQITPLTALGWRNPDAAASLIRQGATFLVSFGIAGALSPALCAGNILIPSVIMTSNRRCLELRNSMIENLQTTFPTGKTGIHYASDTLVASVSDKRDIHTETGALAVDMETASVMQHAQNASIPCAVFRTVADEAGDALPPAAIQGLNAQGAVDPIAVARSILRHPAQVPALIRTGRLSRTALVALQASVPAWKRIVA